MSDVLNKKLGKDKILRSNYNNSFKIPQFLKDTNLRQQESYEDKRFISPIFGEAVNDTTVSTIDIGNGLGGNTSKRFDAFREKPKYDSSNYSEFSEIITNSDRKVYFGEDAQVLDKQNNRQQRKTVIGSHNKLEKLKPIGIKLSTDKNPLDEQQIDKFFEKVCYSKESTLEASNKINSQESYQPVTNKDEQFVEENPQIIIESTNKVEPDIKKEVSQSILSSIYDLDFKPISSALNQENNYEDSKKNLVDDIYIPNIKEYNITSSNINIEEIPIQVEDNKTDEVINEKEASKEEKLVTIKNLVNADISDLIKDNSQEVAIINSEVVTNIDEPQADEVDVVQANGQLYEEVKVEITEQPLHKELEFNIKNVSSRQLQPTNIELPSSTMFKIVKMELTEESEWVIKQKQVINDTLIHFGIDGACESAKKGPTVTRFEIALKPGVNIKKVLTIKDNIQMNLAARSVRIEAPIPGKSFIGIEVPNTYPETVAFGNCVNNKEFSEDTDTPLKIALGVDIDGNYIYSDIAKMPHGLVAGATNSGKSVCINSILVSLLLRNKPEDLKLILIDPKRVELNSYGDIPHLIAPVITDVKYAAGALNWALVEMDRRFDIMSENRARDIKSFNFLVKKGKIKEEKLPYIVIVIDELAELIQTTAKEVEDAVQRITQKARAAGIHLLVATQRPSTDVIKGTIKANIPTRIAFKVSSYNDSMTILDETGAEDLLGKGDMLYKGENQLIRLQGAYLDDGEIFDCCEFLRSQGQPFYQFTIEDLEKQSYAAQQFDEYFVSIAKTIVKEGRASNNSIMQQYKLGHQRVEKIFSSLEDYGIIGEKQGTKAREVLVSKEELDEMLKEIF